MPEHVHLQPSEPQRDTLADALKSLEQGVSWRLIGDAEHFWQKRYYMQPAVRDGSRSSQNGRHENANELREDFVQR